MKITTMRMLPNMAYVKVDTAKCSNIYMPMKVVPLEFNLFRIYIRVGI